MNLCTAKHVERGYTEETEQKRMSLASSTGLGCESER